MPHTYAARLTPSADPFTPADPIFLDSPLTISRSSPRNNYLKTLSAAHNRHNCKISKTPRTHNLEALTSFHANTKVLMLTSRDPPPQSWVFKTPEFLFLSMCFSQQPSGNLTDEEVAIGYIPTNLVFFEKPRKAEWHMDIGLQISFALTSKLVW